MRRTVSITLACLAFSGQAWAWQDLREEFVRDQVACVAATDKTAMERADCAWRLVGHGRPAIHPLGAVARKHPALAWTAVRLLDTIRVNSEVVRLFSSFLDAPPAGLTPLAEARTFLQERLEQMLGRTFASAAERQAWVAENSGLLVYDPARFRFELDAAAYRGGWLPTKPKAGPQLAVSLAFEKLVKALHLGHEPAVRSLIGPAVSLVHDGGRIETRPELDLDAFARPLGLHRAMRIRDEGGGRWLVRTGAAYFFFAGKDLTCVKAGLKPIE